ncbi:xylulokinase [Mycolicibacterium helvum]|uniref:Xylulokinase n=1 Tax=Mycolicibacterium helvum TaxID=1534349 RepID=A0A7I7SYF3_9MYCO|nr:FGGY family carbohydrate kinase [Mycolicibacterium helvum]BBY62062.1 xylulokinase [Mycolicibacterium helvum]
MNAPSVLVVDVGTSSVRATVVDASGAFLAHAARPLALCSPVPGAAEQDAEDWWSATAGALAEVAPYSAGVSALTVTNQQISTVAVDRSGAPLAPAMLWMDQRANEILDAMPAPVRHKVCAITGSPVSSSWSIARPLWWRDREPRVFANADAFLTADAFVYSRLAGRRVTDPSNACFSLMNIHTDSYDRGLGVEVGVDVSLLPEVAPSGSAIGALGPRVAQRLGLPAGLPIVASGSDQPCAALGMGVVRADQVAVTTGTGTFVVRPVATPVTDFRFVLNRGVGDLRYVLMGMHYVSGAAWNWFVDHVDVACSGRGELSQQLLQEVWERESGRRAPLLAPYFSGARSPHFDDGAQATWTGLTLCTSRADMAYSVLESNGFGVRQIVDAMDDVCGEPASVVRLAGGPAVSPQWCQLQADASGLRSERASSAEASTLGAAMVVLVGLGVHASAAEASIACAASFESFVPNPQTETAFAARRMAYEDLYERMKGAHVV